MTDLKQAAQQLIDRIYREGASPMDWREYYALEDALEQQQAEPVQKPPYQGWWPGCQVCGAHGATGFVCPRLDCPTKVTCGGVV